MKKITVLLMALVCLTVKANVIKSPDGRIQVTLDIRDGQPFYQVNYDGKIVIGESPLGIITNIGYFRQRLTLKGVTEKEVKDSYDVRNIKQSHIDYVANEVIASYEQDGKSVMDITFRVSNRDVAFRYTIQPQKNRLVCVVENEMSSFVLRNRNPWVALLALHPVMKHPTLVTMKWERMVGEKDILSLASSRQQTRIGC